MSDSWATTIAVVCCLALVAVVAVDRNRVKRRLDAAEGAVTGLRLDLAAARDRIEELRGYLSRDGASHATAPEQLTDRTVPHRWSSPPGYSHDTEDRGDTPQGEVPSWPTPTPPA